MNTERSVLPVEIPETGKSPYTDEDYFDYRKHTSHLLNCKDMQKNWGVKKKMFLET